MIDVRSNSQVPVSWSMDVWATRRFGDSNILKAKMPKLSLTCAPDPNKARLTLTDPRVENRHVAQPSVAQTSQTPVSSQLQRRDETVYLVHKLKIIAMQINLFSAPRA